MSNEMAICFEDVSTGYGNVLVLEDINFCIQAGSFTGIIGPNGGGKTTLIKLMLGLMEPWRG
ncbi:MAG TPA: ATP-binding cassette domain-containing protein, partial [Syntrophomonas sp.]|nr:ATP-binding cassette domain-containing protein [Syntrophomonas sp.]